MVAVHPREQAKVHRLRVQEYLVLAELPEWGRTELLQGVIYDMPAESRLHALAVRAVYEALSTSFPDDEVLFSGSVEASEYSMPEPDVYVEQRSDDVVPGRYSNAGALLFVAEVSVTTLARDLGPKLETYAEAGIPEYWVVVPRGSKSYLLRHTEPSGTTYRRLERIELPGGVESIDVAAARKV